MNYNDLNLTIVDQLGVLDAEISALKAKRQKLANRVKAKILAEHNPDNRLEGVLYTYVLVCGPVEVLNQKALKKALPEVAAKYTVSKYREKLRGYAKSVNK